MTGTAVDYVELSRNRLQGYEPRRLEAPASMPAAVLLLLTRHEGHDCVVLTVRSYDVEHHKGEISFPGGAVHDADDGLATTALRETWEEIGVRPEHVEIVGQLDDFITISNFVVTPFVGVLKQNPYEFIPAVEEVGEIIQPPLAHLLAPDSMQWEEREVRGRTVRLPAYVFNEHRVWGATARMLQSYLDLIRPRAT